MLRRTCLSEGFFDILRDFKSNQVTRQRLASKLNKFPVKHEALKLTCNERYFFPLPGQNSALFGGEHQLDWNDPTSTSMRYLTIPLPRLSGAIWFLTTIMRMVITLLRVDLSRRDRMREKWLLNRSRRDNAKWIERLQAEGGYDGKHAAKYSQNRNILL